MDMREIGANAAPLEIIAFHLHDQEFCLKTTTIREIRGWAPLTPIPHAPTEVIGVMNLRGKVIPIIDLAQKLGMARSLCGERSAIIVTEIAHMIVGILVDRVSDILTVQASDIHPVPDITTSFDRSFAHGIITRPTGMICFLNLAGIYVQDMAAA